MVQTFTLLKNGSQFTASNAAVSCPASGNTELLKLPVVGITRIFVQLSVATQALDAFIIAGKAHPDATAVTIASAAADFTSPADPIVDASGDLTTIAAAGTGWFIMNVAGFYQITISASGAVNNAAVTIYASGE
jgi:hypothetical protein